MFSVEPRLTHLALTHEQIAFLAQSVNAVSVKVPGFEAEPATAYVVGWRTGPTSVELAIGLHYATSKRSVFYVPETRPLAAPQLGAVAAEAVLFLEEMGFILDDLDYPALAPARQQELVAAIAALPKPAAGESAEELPELEVIAPAQGPEENQGVAGPSARERAIGHLLLSY